MNAIGFFHGCRANIIRLQGPSYAVSNPLVFRRLLHSHAATSRPCLRRPSDYNPLSTHTPLRLSARGVSFTSNPPPENSHTPEPTPGGVSKLLPKALRPTTQSTTSLRKLVKLAVPEKKTISIAVGLVCHSALLPEIGLNWWTAASRFLGRFNVCTVYNW